MTFNPNEAKMYACRAANETNSDNALVLEIVIKNANQKIWHLLGFECTWTLL